MAEAPTCPQCGAPLPRAGWEGLCPSCLVRVSLEIPARADELPEIVNRKSQIEYPIIRSFGDYELLEELARGGMGVVYRARQLSLNRMVAVKMILAGRLASASDVQRFRAEAEAAARLQHPNIVAIHEVGEHEGQHYFSMDYVEGRDLARIVAERARRGAGSPSPGGEGRGEGESNDKWFRRASRYVKTIAEAIHYAHQQGVLHRDLKPSNVLIDVNDQPRVTDFGLAKRFGVPPSGGRTKDTSNASRSSNAQPAEAGTPNQPAKAGTPNPPPDPHLSTINPQLTLSGQVLGSPNFMPPEQATGKRGRIGPHSDVYSLGAILYHLLAGRPPFVGETVAQTLQQLLHTDPIAPRLLNPSVPRDLETICLECLEKEPHRRYAAANDLALDLGRFLNNEPVHARPPSRLYRFQKLARRNKVAFTAAAAILVALVTGLGVATWGLLRERVARARAEAAETAAKTQAARSDQVADFLKEMLKGVKPSIALGRETTMLREILDKTAERLERDLKHAPLVEAELREIIALVYVDLAEFPKAETMARRSLVLRKKVLPYEHPDVATAIGNLALIVDQHGRYNEAETLYREALAIWKRLAREEDRNALLTRNNFAAVLLHQGKVGEAETLLREVLALNKKRFGHDHEDVAESLNNLASVLVEENKVAEAETCYREALDILKKLFPNGHPNIATTLNGSASFLESQARYAEAEVLHRDALAMQKKLLGADHPDVAFSISDIAGVLRAQGKYAEAEAQMREALALRERKLGKDHPLTTLALANLVPPLIDQHKYVEAEALQREALAREKKLHGDENGAVAASLNNLAGVLQYQGKYAEAEPIHRQAIAMAKKLLGADHPHVAGFLNNFVGTLTELGKYEEAEAVGRESLAINKKHFGEDHPVIANGLNDLAENFKHQGNLMRAEELHREALAIRRKQLGSEHPQFALSLINLGDVLTSQSKYAEAEPLYRESLVIARRSATNDPAKTENRLYALADNLYRQHKFAEAQPLYREILESRLSRLPAEHEEVGVIRASLGRFLSDWVWAERPAKSETRKSEGAERAREAEGVLRECLAIRLHGTNANSWRTNDVKNRLGGALLAVAVTDPELESEARQSKLAEAETLLLESAARMQLDKSADRRLTRDALERIVRLYQAWVNIAPASGKAAQAEAWKQKLEAFRTESEPVPAKQKTQ